MKRRNFLQTVAGTTIGGVVSAASSAVGADKAEGVLELRVALTTQAFERLAAFYRVGLGMEPAQMWPEDQGKSLVLDMGKATLEVFDEKQANTVDQIEVGRRVSGTIRFALRVPDVDGAVKRLVAHGAKLVHGPVTTTWGDRTARFEDPDGMQITLYQAAKKA